jgi:hypothetical protein
MMRLIFIMIMLLTFSVAYAEAGNGNSNDAEVPDSELIRKKIEKSKEDKEKKWWENREKRTDIYYPHNAHMEVMDEEGDTCMLCHPYTKNEIKNIPTLKAVTVIANEALKPICHSCHVDEMRGPWRCDLCHDDKEKIWPIDHRSDYINHHAEIAKQNREWCTECHLDMNFCTDCHLRRDTSGTGYHPLGYRTLHGLEARFDPARCGRCHNELYCSDCHGLR